MADISKEQAVQLARESKVIPAVIQSTTCQHFDYIRALTQAAFKLGRNAGLDEAKDIAEHACVWLVASAIESLRDNTP